MCSDSKDSLPLLVIMKTRLIYSKLLAVLLGMSLAFTAAAQIPNYQLVWSDEFDTDGALNTDKWHQQTQLPNGDSWYNGEIQHYTDRIENASVSNGTLKLVAINETYLDQGVTKEYTSARLNSKFAFTYGKVEVRAKLPSGMGTWPAIWMLGKNIIETGAYWTDTHGTVTWPACGEMDIMEHWGINPNYVQSATHTPSSFGATENLGGQALNDVANNFHVYELEWTSEKLVFSVDGNVHFTYQPADQNASTWPFDADQYILLNIAILPEIDPSFTQSAMEVDYVRVYQDVGVTSIEEMNQGAPLFSNPVEKDCVIQVPQGLIGASVTVYSLNGKEMGTFVLDEPRTIQDFSEFEKGIYTIKIKMGTQLFTTKILKI